MTVNYETYNNEKTSFIMKHSAKADWKVETSPMDEYGVYYKNYLFSNGAVWSERMSPEYVKETVEIKFVKVEVEVQMLRVEFWSTEQPSKYYYEAF